MLTLEFHQICLLVLFLSHFRKFFATVSNIEMLSKKVLLCRIYFYAFLYYADTTWLNRHHFYVLFLFKVGKMEFFGDANVKYKCWNYVNANMSVFFFLPDTFKCRSWLLTLLWHRITFLSPFSSSSFSFLLLLLGNENSLL